MKLSARVTALLLSVVVALLTMTVPTAAHATTRSSAILAAPTPGVIYQLRGLSSGQCVAGQSSDRVNVSGCNVAFTDQYWVIEPIGPGFFRLRVVAGGRCLAIISNGNVRISSCVDSFTDQWWRIDQSVIANVFLLSNNLRGTCLAAPRPNEAAISSACGPSSTEQWFTFVPLSF
jgi:hypothetical protein